MNKNLTLVHIYQTFLTSVCAMCANKTQMLFGHNPNSNIYFIFADCVRDHKFYEDGTRTKVDCNGW